MTEFSISIQILCTGTHLDLYNTECLYSSNMEHWLDNKILSLQPVERIPFILETSLNLQCRSGKFITFRFMRWIYKKSQITPYIRYLQVICGFLSSIMGKKKKVIPPCLTTENTLNLLPFK